MIDGSSGSSPKAVALFAALLWGLTWLPTRMVEASGLPGTWAAAGIGVATSAFLLVSRHGAVHMRRATPTASPTRLVRLGAALIGAAVALYAVAITETTVARAVLLFYLAPVWTIAIEAVTLGRRIRTRDAVTVGFCLAGLTLIVGGVGRGFAPGDAAAVTAGIAWAGGATLVFAGPNAPGAGPPDTSLLALIAAAGMAAVTVGMLVAMGAMGSAVIRPAPEPTSIATLIFAGGCFAIALRATLWSAPRLRPTTLTVLFVAEVLAALVSAAVLSGDGIRLQEMAGAAIILLAIANEMAPARRQSS